MQNIPHSGEESPSPDNSGPMADNTETLPASVTLSPFYYSAINEITKPNSLVFVSHYFTERWARDLGPLASMIIIVLRHHCYHDSKTGDHRNQIRRSMSEIAEEVGVSAKTIQREIASNKILQKFIKIRTEWSGGRGDGGSRRDANSYLIAMDDPLHPMDEARLTEIVREKARLTDKGGFSDGPGRRRQGKQPSGQNDLTELRQDNLSQPSGQFVPTPPDKLSRGLGQNDLTLIESLESQENPLNPPAAPGDSLTLFPDGETPSASEDLASEYSSGPFTASVSVPTGWGDLTQAERLPYEERAERELVALFGLAGWQGCRTKERQREVRARNLYEADRTGREDRG